MHRVHAVVLHLQPVARQRELGRRHQDVGRARRRCRRAGTRGRRSGGPRYAKTSPRELVDRVRALAHALAEPARRGLARRLETAPVDVEHPAVIAAADAALGSECRTRATCRDARSAGGARRLRALRSRKTTRSSPRMRTRRGGPSRSRANATGCQNRRRYSPPGVPGPTGVSSGSGAGVTRRTYPSYGPPDARAGDIGGAQHGARSTPRQVASRLPGRSRISAESARRANFPWWVAPYPERGVRWLCQPKNTNINSMLRVAWALLSMPSMFTTQGTSTRSVLTGIAILLTGCLALAGAAQAEVETTPIAMAVDPATFQVEGAILASWPADSSR